MPARVSRAPNSRETGTAQKIDPRTGTYSDSKFVSSFVGYVPADNPRLAMIVLIDEPQGESWGGAVAAPVFNRVGEQVVNDLLIVSHALFLGAVLG